MIKSQEVSQMTGNVEDRMTKLADNAAPQLQAMRDRVGQSLHTAKNATAEATAKVSETLKNAAVTTDDYVHENPWIAIGVAAGIAGAIGFIAGYASAPRKRFWQ